RGQVPDADGEVVVTAGHELVAVRHEHDLRRAAMGAAERRTSRRGAATIPEGEPAPPLQRLERRGEGCLRRPVCFFSVVSDESRRTLGRVSNVTQILSAIEHGDPHAAEELLPLVYDELRQLAAARLSAEKPGQTLQATALVHEAYVRLVGG